MIKANILFDKTGVALPPDQVVFHIKEFGESYKDTTGEIIRNSRLLDAKGEVFIKCASHLLANFGMARSGPFQRNMKGTLQECWSVIGSALLEINYSIIGSGLSRDRYLLDVDDAERDILLTEIWRLTKELLPFTMAESTYGLVAASKILFSVLPEIILPIDNIQWKLLFKTVDLGDAIRFMAKDIKRWETTTNRRLNELDPTRRLTTLPSVYNVMAMAARPIN